ncbi:MAG: MFS transporter [Actinomycetes bacterium]
MSRGPRQGRAARPRSLYRQALATPGAIGFVVPGFVGRMSIAMVGIGLVLLVSSVTDSYGIAGGVAATFALAQSLAGPFVGRLMDRLGQARVLLPAVAVHAGAMLALVAAAESGAPTWTLFVAAGMSGAAFPSLGSLVRARWSHLLGRLRPSALDAAYALESVGDEVIFVLGPVLVTVLSTEVERSAGVLAALAFTVTGSLVLAAHRGSEPPASGASGVRGRSALRSPAVRAVSLVFGGAGLVFAGGEVSVIAYAEEAGNRSDAGWLLALVAVGSMLSGIVYGARTWRSPLWRRFALGACGFGGGTVLMALAPSVPLLGVAAFVFGLGVSPTLIPGFALIARYAPDGRLTEAMSWATTMLGVGIAVGSSGAGRAVDLAGPGYALWLVAVAGLATVVAAAASVPVVAAADRERTGETVPLTGTGGGASAQDG